MDCRAYLKCDASLLLLFVSFEKGFIKKEGLDTLDLVILFFRCCVCWNEISNTTETINNSLRLLLTPTYKNAFNEYEFPFFCVPVSCCKLYLNCIRQLIVYAYYMLFLCSVRLKYN